MNETYSRATVGSKRILVMDDTASVAGLIREMLLGQGHEVDLCHSVEEALAKFVPAKYHLLITDYMMPRMNGVEFAHVVRQRAPGQLILLITGSTFSLHEGDGRKMPVDGVLQKPFSVAEFEMAVSSILTTGEGGGPAITPASQHLSRNIGDQPLRGRL